MLMSDLNVPAGWRVRGDDEIIIDGDRYRTRGADSYACALTRGKTVSQACEEFSCVFDILTQSPLPSPPVPKPEWDGFKNWVDLPLDQRLAINRPAYEALGDTSARIEMYDRYDGVWKSASQVSLFHQFRVKPEPPLVRWLTVSSGGLEVCHSSPPIELGFGARLYRMVESPE
jgi:hypothetical protein